MKTIQQYHDEIMQHPRHREATRLLQRFCSGTTSFPEKQRLLFFGRTLAIVATDYGCKDVVLVASPKSFSEPERRALRHFNLDNLPKRLSPSDLEALVAKVASVDGVWQQAVASFAAEIRKGHEAAAQDRAAREQTARNVAEALLVLVKAAQQDGVLYHDALVNLAPLGPHALRGQSGQHVVTISVTVS